VKNESIKYEEFGEEKIESKDQKSNEIKEGKNEEIDEGAQHEIIEENKQETEKEETEKEEILEKYSWDENGDIIKYGEKVIGDRNINYFRGSPKFLDDERYLNCGSQTWYNGKQLIAWDKPGGSNSWYMLGEYVHTNFRAFYKGKELIYANDWQDFKEVEGYLICQNFVWWHNKVVFKSDSNIFEKHEIIGKEKGVIVIDSNVFTNI